MRKGRLRLMLGLAVCLALAAHGAALGAGVSHGRSVAAGGQGEREPGLRQLLGWMQQERCARDNAFSGYGGCLFARNKPRHYQQWQRMDPREKEVLRRRMQQWQRMSPQEKERYRNRYEQWRRLPPQEQQELKQKLQRWDELSPRERERIRQRFR